MSDSKRPTFADYDRSDVVTRSTAAALLTLSPRTLADWALDGKGPRFSKLGSRTVYQIGKLVDWLDERMQQTA